MLSRLTSRLAVPIAGKFPKRVTADEAVSCITSDSDIYVHSHASTPTELLDALCRHVKRNNLSRIRPAHIILQGRIPWTDSEYWGKIRSNCLFICGNLRPLVNQGHADYVPVFLSDIPRMYHTGVLSADVALISITPPDSRGFSSMGVDIDCSRTATSSAKKIIAIINPSMPRTYGDTVIHISHIDSLVEVNDREIYAKPDRGKPNEVEQAIGKLIAENLVEDEATLQLGIGAIPDSTLAAMINHKDLGIHTEAVSDGVLDLIDAGVITNVKKTVMPGKIVTSYGYGSRKFYDVINENPLFHFESCEWTNRPEVIRSNSKMTCINACIEIDLTGQISSDSIGSTFYSGFGGQVDFISSASTTYDGKGKAIITLPSRTSKGKPKIVGTLSQGSGVVTTRGHVRFVVTEYGIADLRGKNVRQRAYELIRIAHPDDRQMLEKQAFERLNCMPSLD
uniref:Acetyl-CoA hydrolase n=1 Tax=Haemonchus contortus TaxID=6289 RepID=A0A7I4Y2I5_HAECO